MTSEEEYRVLRFQMVKDQIEMRGVRDARLLEALRAVPRHLFMPARYRPRAYDDMPLPIGQAQTISQPYMAAVMTQLLGLSGAENVLEIGTGSGYQAALLSRLASTVDTVELVPEHAAHAARLLAELGCANVRVHQGDGSAGWPAAAPYQTILVTAAAPDVPPALLAQLAPGGRLVIPLGGRSGQVLNLWIRRGEHFERQTLFEVSFVPLRGEAGWSEDDWQPRPEQT